MTRSSVLTFSLLASLALSEGCSVPTGKCSYVKDDGTIVVVFDCGKSDTGIIDSGETGDSVPDTDSAETGDDTAVPIDADNDGFIAEEDCNDGDAAINPDAAEICDGVDNDCTGGADDGLPRNTFHLDTDADGFGDPDMAVDSCESALAGYVSDETDCDDANSAVNPAATEICDGLDNDCDGTIDVGATDVSTFYADTDGDGYGDASVAETACSASAGYVEDATDCDDTVADIHPGAEETDCAGTVDYNCDGSVGSDDADADGFLACEDCDDSEATANPSGTEVCDGLDNDCEGTIDVSATDEATWYADGDGDSYGDPDSSTSACDEPTGYVANSTDCDDTAATAFPGGTEVCDSLNVDEDCNGTAEDAATGLTTWHSDLDTDGYGSADDTVEQCDAPSGYITTASGDEDCDDSDPAVNVDATEACNGYDDDCDGDVDESGSTGETTWYADSDEDGYGDLSTTQLACVQPSKYSEDSGDCDDTDSGINPDEVDIAGDGIDQDCDGADALETDSDGDGDPDSTDCDDANSDVYTGAVEYCDGVDEDCDGVADDGAADILVWYRDADNDGYGNAAITVSACGEPSGYTANSTDCDDTSNDSYPGNIEWCDGTDNDCSGTADDGDYDADGYEVCDDCDDGDAGLNPGEPEACDGEDNDCDGVVDDGVTTEYFLDNDGDGYGDSAVLEEACSASAGYVTNDDDCNDDRAELSPAETQDCYSGLDQDCDGDVSYSDTDCGSGAFSSENLFTTGGSWNGESAAGVGSIGNWVAATGSAPSYSCATAYDDSCALAFTGPGSWLVTSDGVSSSGTESIACVFSVASSAASTEVSYTIGSVSSSTTAGSAGWYSEAPSYFTRTGAVTLQVTISTADTLYVDSVICVQ